MTLPLPDVPTVGTLPDPAEHGTTDPSSSETGGGRARAGITVLLSQRPARQVGRCS